jgi:uncharacterized protein YndB with AHSA1/START domain
MLARGVFYGTPPMTEDRDFKRLVRSRAARTGESYTTARATLLKQQNPGRKAAPVRTPSATVVPATPAASAPAASDYAAIAGMSDEAVAAKTGCTWERWVWALDQVEAHRWPHSEIARYLGEKYKVPAWWRQMIAVGYERVRGLRERGQMRAGHFSVSKSRTFPVAASTLFRAFKEPGKRARWMPGTKVAVRSATVGKVVRFTWSDGSSVEVRFTTRDRRKTSVAVEHTRIASKAEAEWLRAWWGERLEAVAGVVVPRRRTPTGVSTRTSLAR